MQCMLWQQVTCCDSQQARVNVEAKAQCNKYKEVEDFIEITQSSNSYGTYSISFSVKLIHIQMDDCQV